MQTATWLVSRELTEAAGPWDTRLLADDDGEYFFRVIRSSDSIKIRARCQSVLPRVLGVQMQSGCLRAMEDSARVRAACVNYLQTWFIHFYPTRPVIVEAAQELAASLGEHLECLELSWKYAWIRKMLGWSAAKRAQLSYNQYKSSVVRSWDKAMLLLR
jgi:hypothetical protein